jgi:hypothetical protein
MRVADRHSPTSNGRTIGRAAAAALAVLALAACSGGEAPDNTVSPEQAEAPSSVSNTGEAAPSPAATGPAPAAEPTGNAADPRPAAKAGDGEPGGKAAAGASADAGAKAAATDGPCERLPAAEAGKATGLKAAGSAGSYRFFARPRELLCSEPGTGGIGECEIVGSAVIRVEHGGGAYGLRSRAGTPALLRYGPNGITCISPSR